MSTDIVRMVRTAVEQIKGQNIAVSSEAGLTGHAAADISSSGASGASDPGSVQSEQRHMAGGVPTPANDPSNILPNGMGSKILPGHPSINPLLGLFQPDLVAGSEETLALSTASSTATLVDAVPDTPDRPRKVHFEEDISILPPPPVIPYTPSTRAQATSASTVSTVGTKRYPTKPGQHSAQEPLGSAFKTPTKRLAPTTPKNAASSIIATRWQGCSRQDVRKISDKPLSPWKPLQTGAVSSVGPSRIVRSVR